MSFQGRHERHIKLTGAAASPSTQSQTDLAKAVSAAIQAWDERGRPLDAKAGEFVITSRRTEAGYSVFFDARVGAGGGVFEVIVSPDFKVRHLLPGA